MRDTVGYQSRPAQMIPGCGIPGRSRRWAPWIAGLAAAAVLFSGLTVRLFVWPDLAPLPAKVDAIVELGGPGSAARDRLALDLARRRLAPVLVQSTASTENGASTCLPAPPDVVVRCFHPNPNTTRGEARYVGEQARQGRWRSMVVITTRDHAWRARLRISRCFSGQVYVAVSPLPMSRWPVAVPYQWGATGKAVSYERGC